MMKGIISSGTWVIDNIKYIDTWPSQGNLCYVEEELKSTGGAPANVLLDLARMETGFPLYAAGVIGKDENGEFILNILKRNGIDTKYLVQTEKKPTAHTDVMTERKTGRRTFFYNKGSNEMLDFDNFTGIDAPAKIFHLGYLLALDRLDSGDYEYGIKAARILDLLQKKGYRTSLDVVSEENGRFRKIILPCLKYTDYLIINEIEAGKTAGFQIRDENNEIDARNLLKSAEELMKRGIREMAVIHFPEGGFALEKSGKMKFMPSYEVSPDEIKGAVGAGDAFCSGMLYGIHESMPLEESIQIANACSRFNLLNPAGSEGAVSLSIMKEWIKTAPVKQFRLAI